MRRDWLLYLVICSLALNLGTIGTFAYLYWQRPPGPPPPLEGVPIPFHQLLRDLNLDAQQRQTLKALAPEHWRKVREFQDELAQERQTLVTLFKQGNLPDWPSVQAKVKEISTLQCQLEEEKVHHLLEIQKNLRPDQRQVLVTQLEKRVAQCCEPGRGRGRGMMRRQRGPGQGYGPQGPPPGPPPGDTPPPGAPEQR